jgi:hypothetical protein
MLKNKLVRVSERDSEFKPFTTSDLTSSLLYTLAAPPPFYPLLNLTFCQGQSVTSLRATHLLFLLL